MRKIIWMAIIVFVAQTWIYGQAPADADAKRYIEVSGTSETEVTPDELYITITLRERMENKEKITIEKQEKDLRDNIKGLGIDLANLTLSSADADFGKVRRSQKDVLVSKSYILKVTSAEMLSKVYERLDAINVYDAYISRFTHSKIIELQKENRVKALRAAKEKVDYLLTAIGQQAGTPLQITETGNYVQEYNNNRKAMASNIAQSYSNDRFLDSEGETAISFKKIKIRSSYLVRYEILNK